MLAKLEQEQEDTRKEENIVTEKTVRILEASQKIRGKEKLAEPSERKRNVEKGDSTI